MNATSICTVAFFLVLPSGSLPLRISTMFIHKKQTSSANGISHHIWVNYTKKNLPNIQNTCKLHILLMEEIVHQSIWQIFHSLQGFLHVGWLARFLNHQQYHQIHLFHIFPPGILGEKMSPRHLEDIRLLLGLSCLRIPGLDRTESRSITPNRKV